MPAALPAFMIGPNSTGRTVLLVFAALVATVLGGCNRSAPAEAPQPAGTDKPTSPAVEWRQGDDNSFIAHRFEQQVTRCWNVQGKYDCLVAQSIGLKDVIPGAPARLALFRFQSAALPKVESELEQLATSDGYACELTTLPDRTVLNETFWDKGRVVSERSSSRDAARHWTAADVQELQAQAGSRNPRPFFACPRVIDPILDVGLFALDSNLVSYESVFSSVDYPEAGGTEGVDDSKAASVP